MAAGVSRRERFLPETTCWCCNYKPLKLLLLVRRQNHDHLTTFHLGHLLDQRKVLKIGPDSLDLAHADFLVRHFAATEAQSHFHFVLFLQEARHVAQLDLVVVFVRTRAELDFLDLNLLLLELLLMLPLLFLVLEFAEIHNPANGRLRHRSNLNQINASLFGQLQGLSDSGYAECLSIFANQPNLGCVDLFVNALRLLQCDGSAP